MRLRARWPTIYFTNQLVKFYSQREHLQWQLRNTGY